MVKLKQVRPLPEYRLYVEYDDGVAGEIDLSSLVGKGVFAAWSEPGLFDSVTVGSAGEIRWSDELEICADAAYLDVSGKSPGDLFPKLKQPADA